MEDKVERKYCNAKPLKYGCNPHQSPAAIYNLEGTNLPFEVLNGTPGYINLLDALNAWQLVLELRSALSVAAAASFKHVSPAGAGVAVPLTDIEREIYDVGQGDLSPSTLAYLRAREADPKSSFGDFAALSDKVDEATAAYLQKEVSDGIIAPDFDEKALAILKGKKGGSYIILKGNPEYQPPALEYREVFGVVFAQRRNDLAVKGEHFQKIVTRNADLGSEAVRDLVLATIAVKYTQSNSVTYALNGQLIGVGAGQQSRVDCVKLAGQKAENWYLRQHPKVRGLRFKPKLKRVTRVNARVQYIEGDMTEQEREAFESLFEQVPEPLSVEEKTAFLRTLKGVSLSSDAFFPFRDNIDQASKRGVTYIAQPGGSVQDKEVVAAADEYGMLMCFQPHRLFHH